MVIDTSAIIAILKREPERPLFFAALAAAPVNRISAATLVELMRVVKGMPLPTPLEREVADLLGDYQVQIMPFDAMQAEIATAAMPRFGKGLGQRSGLNLGDLFAYSLAKALDEPLLFKGDDFAITDVVAAC